MATSSIIFIVVVAVVVVALLVVLTVLVQRRRAEHHRVEAAEIRDRAGEQSHLAAQREALATATAARARAAQAEADVKAAEASGLAHRAAVQRGEAVDSRNQVNREYSRADSIDPDSEPVDAPPESGRGR